MEISSFATSGMTFVSFLGAISELRFDKKQKTDQQFCSSPSLHRISSLESQLIYFFNVLGNCHLNVETYQ
jgi:hypothetical protein